MTIGSGFVYLFLWFRQRIFHVHPSLKVLSNKVVQFISFSIIAVWLLFYLSLFISYLNVARYRFQKPVGRKIEESVNDNVFCIVIGWLIVSILMQIGLLFLFLYPIFKNSTWRSDQQQNERNTFLLRRVKKAVALTVTCLTTDFIIIAIGPSLSNPKSNFGFPTFAINLMINHLITIACFDHWRKLLWPWNICLKNVFNLVHQDRRTASISNNAVTFTAEMHAA